MRVLVEVLIALLAGFFIMIAGVEFRSDQWWILAVGFACVITLEGIIEKYYNNKNKKTKAAQ